jgi:hypothetical protein
MWMLVLILVASNNAGGVHTSTTSIQFQTQEACTAAETKLGRESGAGSGFYLAVRTSCVKTN